LISKYNIPEVQLLVEAGCHDGSDTVKWLELGVKRVLAFEPDPVAFKKATQILAKYLADGRAVVFPHALSHQRGKIHLSYGLNRGDGNTQIQIDRHGAEDSTENSWSRSLDDYLSQIRKLTQKKEVALLWLDVEGHALPVIQGATNSLTLIDVAKIEVEFKNISPSRQENWLEVVLSMRRLGFKIARADIHPGFFGDILFIRNRHRKTFFVLLDAYFLFVSLCLRKVVYPVLNTAPNKDHSG
jgi:FkbM family methyltransferase